MVLMPLTYITAGYVFRNLALGPIAPIEAEQPPAGGNFPPGVVPSYVINARFVAGDVTLAFSAVALIPFTPI